jgi:uncharacterized RDD family membrane protein YckC
MSCVGSWTGSWLSGPGSVTAPDPATEQEWWGQRLGLPETGPGSVSSFGRRVLAYGVDTVLSVLLALSVSGPMEDSWGLAVLGAFAAQKWLLVGVAGQTLGMRLLGLRVAPLAAGGPSPRVPGLGRALVRTVLLLLLLPALMWDADNRGYHDKIAGTVVLRTR